MAYTKTNWIDGETPANATNMNHLEQGVEAASTYAQNLDGSETDKAPNVKAVKDYVDNEVKDVYSTDEVKTNKVWIDGKPIYRKVYEISSLPDTNNRIYVTCNIANVENLIKMRGVMKSSTEWDNLPGAYTNGPLVDSLVIERSGSTLTQIRILTNTNRSAFSAFVILEYTKTTDSGTSSSGDNSPTK